jgi:hypothetical protein
LVLVAVNWHHRSIFGVGCHNATDMKKYIYGVGCPSIADTINLYSGWVNESLVSCDLVSRYQRWIYGVGYLKPANTISKIHIQTIFEYFKFKFIQYSNSYKIQIHIIIFTYIQIIAKYFKIFKFIVCTHFHIVENSKLHQLFIQQIFHKYIVEETPLTSRACRRMCHLHGRNHVIRTCTCPI